MYSVSWSILTAYQHTVLQAHACTGAFLAVHGAICRKCYHLHIHSRSADGCPVCKLRNLTLLAPILKTATSHPKSILPYSARLPVPGRFHAAIADYGLVLDGDVMNYVVVEYLVI